MPTHCNERNKNCLFGITLYYVTNAFYVKIANYRILKIHGITRMKFAIEVCVECIIAIYSLLKYP